MAAMLDLEIRDATDGQRSLDDLMRSMFAHFSNDRGFATDDLERLATEVCGRNLKSFFDAYVRGAQSMDFNRYLALAGLTMEAERKAVRRMDGSPLSTVVRIRELPNPTERQKAIFARWSAAQ